ncbi:MAG TPA: sugar phosphate isomerase/epimerase [Abditibacteriaceae bacterium]|jgi:sugar phosphate isomerase/epimerase
MPFTTANLAVQMYTIRDFITTEKDLAESLKKIKDIGYNAVQLSAVGAMNGESPEVSAARARQLLDDNGLKCIATHRSWDDLANKTEQEIEFHQTLGCDYAAIGSLPGGFGTPGAEAYSGWARDAQPTIARLKEAGIGFGYHNHAFEFARVEPGDSHNPQTFFDLLVENGGNDLTFEIDVYWIDHSGANARKWIEKLNGKIPVIHIKDKEMVGNDPHMAPIGEGNLDWDELLPALDKSGTQWVAVEQDTCRRDPFDCLKSSFEFLKNHSSFR